MTNSKKFAIGFIEMSVLTLGVFFVVYVITGIISLPFTYRSSDELWCEKMESDTVNTEIYQRDCLDKGYNAKTNRLPHK